MKTILNYTEKMGGINIDRRTSAGKELIKKVKKLNKLEMIETGEQFDLHPALTPLRFKDVDNWIRNNNINLN